MLWCVLHLSYGNSLPSRHPGKVDPLSSVARPFIVLSFRSLFVVAALAASMAMMPQAAHADPPHWSVSVTADRSTTTPGQSAWFTATATGPSFYNSGHGIALIDNATGNTLAFCGSNTCTAQMSSPWSANELQDPPDFSVSAVVRSFSSVVASNVATAGVSVERYLWSVGLTTNAQSTGEGRRATVGSTVTFTGTAGGVSLSNTGFRLEVVDVATGQVLCWGNPGTTCTAAKFVDWWRNSASPLSSMTVVARVSSMANPSVLAGASDPITVTFDRYEWNVGLVATPSSVTPGQTASFTATSGSTYGTGYQLVIVNDVTGAVLRTCSNGGTCSGTSFIGWDQNPSPQPLRIRAEVRNVNNASDVAGLAGPITIDVNKFIWGVNVTSDRATMRPGETAWVTATINSTIQNTGYHVVLVDDETGNAFKWCYSGTQCTGPVSVGWSENGEVAEKSVRAEVRNSAATPDIAGMSEPKSIYVDSYWHTVELAATAPATAGQQWTLTASATPKISQLGYTLQIEKEGVGSVRTCSLTVSCSTAVGDGAYRAVVRSGAGKSFGESDPILIDGMSSHSGTQDGIDLLYLATAIGSTSLLCEELLTTPGTSIVPPTTSVTDQEEVCLSAEAAGKSIHETLRLIAATVGGTTVLWYLVDQKAGNFPQPAPGETPDANRPVPPPFWPSDISDSINDFLADNPGVPETAAEVISRNCAYVLPQAGLNPNLCKTLPVFASGTLDVPQATAHDRRSILLYNQSWASLNYRPNAEGIALGLSRNWFKSLPNCMGLAADRICHEFPFYSTMQGGPTAVPLPLLQPIDKVQNRTQGGRLGNFVQSCGLTSGRRYINLPMPWSTRLPTTYTCGTQ